MNIPRSISKIGALATFLCTLPTLDAAPVNSVVATIPVGVTPAGMALTPDGHYLYVANNNNYGIAGSDSVTVIDTATNTVVTTITDASFNEPYTITINAEGTRAYVTNSNVLTITILDLTTNSVIGVMTGFDGPSGMVITPDGRYGYVNNYGGVGGVGSGNGTTVRVVDLTTNTIVGPAITVGQAPAALAISPDGAYVYSINYVDGNPGTGTTSVIRTSDNTVVATITGFSGPFGIALSPDGLHAYVTNFGSNNFAPYGTTVSVIDLRLNQIVDTIKVGIQPSGVGVTPDGKYVYVTNYNTLYAGPGFTNLTAGAGTVEIIDTATNAVIPPIIAVGESPDYVTISPDGQFAYISNYTSNTVNVIALPSFTLAARGCHTTNRFLTRIQPVDKITWSVTGTSLPVSYSLYADEELTDLIGTVPAQQPHQFFVRDVDPTRPNIYYLVGTNKAGTMSAPLEVRVTNQCQ